MQISDIECMIPYKRPVYEFLKFQAVLSGPFPVGVIGSMRGETAFIYPHVGSIGSESDKPGVGWQEG